MALVPDLEWQALKEKARMAAAIDLETSAAMKSPDLVGKEGEVSHTVSSIIGHIAMQEASFWALLAELSRSPKTNMAVILSSISANCDVMREFVENLRDDAEPIR